MQRFGHSYRMGWAFTALTLAGTLFVPGAGSQTQPPFRASVSSIGPALAKSMTSWHRGCPVPISDLRLVEVSFWGFDGRAHQGKLILHMSYTSQVVTALRTLSRSASAPRQARTFGVSAKIPVSAIVSNTSKPLT